MYKVCLNNSNEIIGFNLKNSIYYINLFNINNITKDVKEYKKVQLKDSLGRKLYYQYNKKLNITSIVYIVDNNSNDYIYTPITTLVPIINKVDLMTDTSKFTLEDLISIKKEQLITNYNCKDCLLYELLDDSEIIISNANIGKNIIKINANNEIISNKISLLDNSKISIYCESDNEISISISNDNKEWYNIEKDNFINYDKKDIYIKLFSLKETNIYSIAILIN